MNAQAQTPPATQNISLTRLLTEIKKLDARIALATSTGKYVGVVVGEAKRPTDRRFNTVETLQSFMQSSFDSVFGLIDRRAALYRALVKANNETEVTIAGSKFTIAEAIDQKKIVAFKRSMLIMVRTQNHQASIEVDAGLKAISERIEKTFQGQGTDAASLKTAAVEAVRQLQEQQFKPILVTAQCVPNGDVNAYIMAEDARLAEFETEVDFALSEVNARTLVSVPA